MIISYASEPIKVKLKEFTKSLATDNHVRDYVLSITESCSVVPVNRIW